MKSRQLIFVVALFFSAIVIPTQSVTAYVPRPGDNFSYYETQSVGSGSGSYLPYSDHAIVNGHERMNSAYSNGTVAAHYGYTWNFTDYTGNKQNQASSGNFTYSSTDFLYLKGTDNQMGYTNPTVWFLMDSALPTGSTFYLLDTLMTVKDTSHSYYLSSHNGYVSTILAEGTGYYQRDDSYGVFSATYTWDAYFDPSTGYIVGYNWNEHDANSTSGDGFTYTEALYVTSTSYSLTTTSAPSSGTFPLLYIALGVLLFGLLIALIVAAIVIRRGRKLPKHTYVQNYGPAPPTVDLTPKQQPAQQIVIKEVVKVKCQYCGALIDSTVQRCPFCGAPRT